MSQSQEDAQVTTEGIDPLATPERIAEFNRIAQLAHDGASEAALAAWDALLLEAGGDGGALAPGDFHGQVLMRRAWAMMDLERYEDATKVFASEALQKSLLFFQRDTLFWYFFSYGNVLGERGEIEAMDDQFTRALGVAARDLQDLQRCQLVWQNLLHFAQEHSAWSYLEQECENALRFASEHSLSVLKYFAGLRQVVALQGLGRQEEARTAAQALLEQARLEGVDEVRAPLEALLGGAR